MMLKRAFAHFHRVVLRRAPDPSISPRIVVLIPLISRARADDWSVITANLKETLKSVARQSYRNVDVVLCCQDWPDSFPDEAGFHFVKADPEPAKGMSDKKQKLKAMSRYVSKTFREYVYVMILDADDLLHPELFEYVASDNNGTGYLIDKGYMLDIATGEFARLMPDPDGKLRPFNNHCGSCAVFGIDFRRNRSMVIYLDALGAGHSHYREIAALFGYPLQEVPFHAAIYVMNHGENMRKKRGKLHGKMNYLQAHKIPDASVVADIKTEFGL